MARIAQSPAVLPRQTPATPSANQVETTGGTTPPDWEQLRNRPLTLAEKRAVRRFYEADYVTGGVYGDHHAVHYAISETRHRLLRAVFPDHGKVLDMGCSTGRDVQVMRTAGIDAWGFDLCPDLPDVALPDARPFLRMGRADHIPFSKADGFRTLISYDVLEHIPENDLAGLPGELDRLGIQNLSLVIAADTISPGHITIHWTDWWLELFARVGFRVLSELEGALQEMPFPWAWDGEANQAKYALFTDTGNPRNGWNQVPGWLFLTRD